MFVTEWTHRHTEVLLSPYPSPTTSRKLPTKNGEPPAAEFRGLGGSSVEFVFAKLDQQDVKAAEFAPVAGKISVALYQMTW
jgi:hypothetical protein